MLTSSKFSTLPSPLESGAGCRFNGTELPWFLVSRRFANWGLSGVSGKTPEAFVQPSVPLCRREDLSLGRVRRMEESAFRSKHHAFFLFWSYFLCCKSLRLNELAAAEVMWLIRLLLFFLWVEKVGGAVKMCAICTWEYAPQEHVLRWWERHSFGDGYFF